MASRSSRRKNASRFNLEHVQRLLQDGSGIPSPSPGVLECALGLKELGLIEFREREYVRCANPEDRDYPPRNRYCRGRIYVDDGEVDLCCPECDRQVYPGQYCKSRYGQLHTSVRPEGVEEYIQSLLKGLEPPPKRLAAGVFRVEVDDEFVTMCVVEYADGKYRTRDHALAHKSVFIVVETRDLDQRFLDEDWVVRATLAELICGEVDLAVLVRSAASSQPPAHVRQVAIPICARGPLAVITEPQPTRAPRRHFVVEVGPNIVRIEGVKVVAPQAGPRFKIFQHLWERFLEDLMSGLEPKRFRAVPLKELIRLLETSDDAQYDDETHIRRVVNRLQQDMETSLKKQIGAAIDREDIIQTCPWVKQSKGNYGYRLNPFSVMVRPFQ